MPSPSVFTLNQLNSLIKSEINSSFSEPVHFVAEINSMTVNRSGHAYLDLVEKSSDGDSIIAQLRATIWAGHFRMIKPYFETVTGETLRPGIKIMACGQIGFHEVYGLSVNITSITPEYTVGEMAMQRQQTIRQLTGDGVIDLNKELELPMLIKNIAVISSPTAAGYGDFVKQLQHNPNGYGFNVTLFQAVMQGDEAVDSIISQLEVIADHSEMFDCIALIRGGGSKADLSCFDKYRLCQYLCQSPLPVITGIGHDRDESVADLVAHTPLKTPTAVAQFIIDRAEWCDRLVDEKIASIQRSVRRIMEAKRTKLTQIIYKIHNSLHSAAMRKRAALDRVCNSFVSNMKLNIQQKNHCIDVIRDKIELNNPVNILRKGYSYTMHNGKPVLSASQLAPGDTVTTVFFNGTAESSVTKIETK